MRGALAALWLLVAWPAFADSSTQLKFTELKLLSEHPVEGMRGGNLSGLARCGKTLWTVSDRDDDLLYRLDISDRVWRAEGVHLEVPSIPDSGLPKDLQVPASLNRGGDLDFEGVSCDDAGNRYIVSESHATVLKVPVSGEPQWLKIAPNLVRQARDNEMLLHFNAIFEGLAVNPKGDRIWLAAERERRGLLQIKRRQTRWDCDGACVLFSEGGSEMQPPQFPNAKAGSRDFADLSLFNGKLFTLERNAYRICRRNVRDGQVEHCWSFAAEALAAPRLYPQNYGLAEALVVDAEGAWIGLDNNNGARADGETRPIVWRFAAPQGGWSARP
ncbi:esterase-like activity of phytase family protein [Pseudomonas agarici]|uniref:esterase-like activity of phytase family protein n=1 Tax=Pseudomonas agarici TaxID=46677 RepID=UPI000301E9AC|nr:esterase-like activity of phytase family protein [Pseudomonas agarici]NWB90916.1 esterase-like activity of phytase family protein [Pseudomonas agarici]NWC11490.1 esterase-like activity of phytase family protein [Pseudomonas agarici]SEK97530.1 Esterase-like activity of phytase [Pseudomonas agarici]